MPGSILLVDDNRDTADAIALLLRECGHDVATAYSAPEALDLLDTNAGIPNRQSRSAAEQRFGCFRGIDTARCRKFLTLISDIR